MIKRNKAIIFASISISILVLGFLILGPYASIYSIKKAIDENDGARVAELIDIPKVRESIKRQLTADFNKEISEELEDNPFAFIGVAFVASIIDKVLEIYVSERGLIYLLQSRQKDIPVKELQRQLDKEGILSNVARNNPLSFEMSYLSLTDRGVTVRNLSNDAHIVLTLSLEGMGWKVVDIKLP